MYTVEAVPARELGNTSFLVADTDRGVGLVIDPLRDIDRYLKLASDLNLKPLGNLWCSHELLKRLRVRLCLREPVGWHGYAPTLSAGSGIRNVLPLFRNSPKIGE